MRTTSTTVDHNIECTTRDGVVLRADAYRPDAPGRFPALVCRTPYSKSRENHVEIGTRLAERGYVVLFQDVRGRYESEGDFRPGFFSAEHDDAEDGYDTVEWAARLPWSNGRVGTFGISYAGWTQWELAHARPPRLRSMFAGGIAANLLDRELGGVLRAGRVIYWSICTLAPDARRRLGHRDGPWTVAEAERLWRERDRNKWLWRLPLSEIPERELSAIAPHFRSWLADHATDFFRFREKHSSVDVPVLSMTGWYDQQIGTIGHFTGMTRHGGTPAARSGARLIIGPWTHSYDLSRRVGEIDFGPHADCDYVDLADRWFSRTLKGRSPELEAWAPIRLFVMGENRWRDEAEWPLARTRYTEFFLHSGGAANTPLGDGSLSQAPPGEEPPDEYAYDPRDPVMTLYSEGGQHEPRDQRALAGRRDVLVYQTPPLERPVEVTGPITLTLWAASSAPDTDFTAKLIDAWPSGFAQELSYGIVRARYRDSMDAPSLLEPGAAYEFTIRIQPTGNLFKAGHRIRVDVSSSDFPNFDRNHNTGRDDWRDAELRTARQTVFHDARRPSRIALPVIPR